MKTKSILAAIVTCGLLLAAAVQTAQAQTTYTWANANITATPATPLNWFNATQGTWTGGTPVSGNVNTIQFFQDTTTALLNTGATGNSQTANVDNGGSAFQLGTLTLNGKASATTGANLTNTISGDPLNFSASTGTINVNALNNGNKNLTYNLNSAVQLGTASSACTLTIQGGGSVNGGTAAVLTINGLISELQAGGGSLLKSGSSYVNIANTANSFTGGVTVSGGTITWGGDARTLNGNNVTFTGNATMQVFTGTFKTMAGGIAVNPGVTASFSLPSATWGLTTSGALTGSGTVTVAGASATGVILNFLNANNTFTGPLNNSTLLTAGGGFNVASLADSASAITMGSAGTSAAAFSLDATTPSPVIFTSRQFVMGTVGAYTFNLNNNASSAASTFAINTDLSVTGSGAKTLSLGGTNPGTNTFAGLIANGSGTIGLAKAGAGTWIVSGANTYTGPTTISAGTLSINSIKSVGGVANPLGQPLLANATISIGSSTTAGALVYTGTGDTSDRVINLAGTTGGATLDQSSASGLLKFTSAFTATGAGAKTLTLQGSTAGTGEINAAIVNSTSATALTKAGTGTWTLSGANTYSGTTTVSGGTLKIDTSTGSLYGTTPWSALTFGGSGTFNYDNTSASGTKSQSMGALTFSAGEGTLQTTKGGATGSALTFASLAARTAGASGNFVSGGATDTANKIVFTVAPTLASVGIMDKGEFFGGSSYAAYDASGYVRALVYGTDGATVAADTITASKHVKLTSSPASRVGDTLLSLNLAGSGVNYTMSSGTLTCPTILKAGGGSSTISGGTAVTGGANTELVIRTDTSSDSLAIGIPLTQGTGILTKSGAGTLTLSAAGNTYSGATKVNAGTLLVNGTITGAGAVTVQPGATLGGSGSVAGAVTVNVGGAIQLGAGGSTLTLGSGTPASYGTGSILKILATASTLDKVSSAATTLNIAGMDLVIDTTSLIGNVASTAIVALTGASPVITGPFRSVTVIGNTAYTPTLDYSTAGQVKLALNGPAPSISTSDTLGALSTTYGTASATTSFHVSGANMLAGITVTPPAGFEVSTTSDFSSNVGNNSSPITVGSSGTIASTQVYVRLAATATVLSSPYSGNVVCASSSVTPVNVATASSTVSKADPTVTVTGGGSYGYTTTPQGPTAYTISLAGDTGAVTWSYDGTGGTSYSSSTRPTAVGTYTATVSLAADDNFNAASSTPTAFSIDAVPTIILTGPLSAANTTYGTASPTPTSFTVSGISLTGAPGNLTVTPPSGYEVSLSSGSGYSTSLSVPYTSDTLVSTYVYVRLAATDTVRSYAGTITVAGGGDSKTIATVSSTVSPQSLTITAQADSKTYGQTKTYGPGLTASTYVTISGLKNSDVIDTVTITDSNSGGLASAVAGGTYNLTPSAAHFSTGSATNYTIGYSTGLLTVNKADPTVTVTVGTYYGNGSPQGPTNYTTSPTGDTGTATWSYAGTGTNVYGPTSVLPTAAGTYSATVSLAADGNFNAASSSATAFTIIFDNTAPTPNPMTFASVPTNLSSSTIRMTASTATDETSSVQYYFTETTGNPGGVSSGWQSSPIYTNSGLTPSTLYTYTVKARDQSLNETTASAPESVTTPVQTAGLSTSGTVYKLKDQSEATAGTFVGFVRPANGISTPYYISLYNSTLRFSTGFGDNGGPGVSATIPVSVTNPGTVLDYRFYTGSAFAEATNGPADVIGGLSYTTNTGTALASRGSGAVWIGHNPDNAYPFGTATDNGQGWGSALMTTVTVTNKISGLTSGTIYVFYGVRTGGTASLTATMKDTNGAADLVLPTFGAATGAVPSGNTEAWFVTSFDFINDGTYQTIEYTYSDSLAGGGAFLGTVVVGPATPTLSLYGALGAMSTTYGTASPTPTNFIVAGANLTGAPGNLTVTPPSGYEVSLSSGSGYTTSLSVPYSSATLSGSTVYVRLAATATVTDSPYSGNITVSGGGASSQTIATVSSTVTKATPTATLAVNNSPATYDGSGKSATVAISSSSTAGTTANVLTGGAASQTAAGTYPVTANFVPDDTANYNTLTGVTATNSFVISKATSSITLVSSAPSVGYHAAVFFTASGLPGTATSNLVFSANGVSFSTNNVVSGGATSGSITNLPRGDTNVIQVTYSGDANCNSASQSLTQTVTNHPPATTNVTYTRTSGLSLKIAITNLMSHVGDADGDATFFVDVSTTTTNGGSLSSDANYIYVPTNNVTDAFTYRARDNYGGTNTGTVTLTINGNVYGGAGGSVSTTSTNATALLSGIPYFWYTAQRGTNADFSLGVTNFTPAVQAGTNGAVTITDDFGDLFGQPNSGAPSAAYYRLKYDHQP